MLPAQQAAALLWGWGERDQGVLDPLVTLLSCKKYVSHLAKWLRRARKTYEVESRTLLSDAESSMLEKAARRRRRSILKHLIKNAFKKDAGGALEDLIRSLSKMNKAQRLAAVQGLFGKGSGITRLMLDLADSVDKNLSPSLDRSTQAWKDANGPSAGLPSNPPNCRTAGPAPASAPTVTRRPRQAGAKR